MTPNKNNNNMKNVLIREVISWILLLVVLFFASRFLFSSNTVSVKTVPYSEFLSYIDNGELSSAVIKVQDNVTTLISGTLKDGTEIQAKTLPYSTYLEDKLYNSGITYDVQQTTSTFWTLFWNIVPWIVMLLLWWFFMQRMMNSAGSSNQAFSFGKSKAKLFLENKPQTTFKDVAGADEVKEEVKEIIEFLKIQESLPSMGQKFRKEYCSLDRLVAEKLSLQKRLQVKLECHSFLYLVPNLLKCS